MTRTVYNRHMVAHLWAVQSQDSARTGNGSLYFSGETIYSYGSHFPIARHVTNKRGERAILLTTRGYSVTTRNHISQVWRAIGNRKTFRVSDPCAPLNADMLREYRERLLALAASYNRAKGRKPAILESIQACVSEGNSLAEFIGSRQRIKFKGIEKLSEECARPEKRENARKLAAEKKRERETSENLAEWMEGKRDFAPAAYRGSVRLRIAGENVETSLGATFPLSHALKALPLVQACRDNGREFAPNVHSIHLGHFSIDRIDTGGNVWAGCHYVEWSEIARVAKLAGAM